MNTPDTTEHSSLPLTRKILIRLLVIALALIATTGKKALRDKEQQINLQAKKIEAAEAQIAAQEKKNLILAAALTDPGGFVTLEKGTRLLVFKGFKGTLQWFTAHELIGNAPPSTSYSPLGGSESRIIIITDHDKDGFRLVVPPGAKAYSIKGGPANGRGYTVDHMIK